MAIAKYFSKDLLAINQLIKSNQSNLEAILLKNKIAVAFDQNAIDTREGQKALDLLIRLLSRFYPLLSIIDLTSENEEKVTELSELAKSINSRIEIFTDLDDVSAVILAGVHG